MKTSARLLLTALIATAMTVLSGCASHPELRAYTAEETRQLQLEALQRQGLSLDEYEQRRLVIQRAGSDQVLTEVAERSSSSQG